MENFASLDAKNLTNQKISKTEPMKTVLKTQSVKMMHENTENTDARI